MAIGTADQTRHGWHGEEQVPGFPCLCSQTAKYAVGGAIATYGLTRCSIFAMSWINQGKGKDWGTFAR